MPRRLVLLGHPVAHSLSPRMQNAALAAARIPLVYEALDVAPADLAHTIAALCADGAAGNVTIPHKPAVAAACTRRSAIADRAGAVNTFWFDAGALVGDNTDVEGFHAAAATLLGHDPGAERVALLGAGGSASAVLCAVERWGGASVAVYNRTMPAADTLVARFAHVASVAATRAAALRDATLVVNATSLGLDGTPLPTAIDELPPGAALLDLVYRPEETAWVRAARLAGHRASDGLTMLVEQGAAAFERWFGRPADRAAMWAAVR